MNLLGLPIIAAHPPNCSEDRLIDADGVDRALVAAACARAGNGPDANAVRGAANGYVLCAQLVKRSRQWAKTNWMARRDEQLARLRRYVAGGNWQ